ncbi:MAG: hypothetical protein LBR73_06260 [Oscillospiraceae bacterium]|jgi:hypothetical protein|nr:hypothetical protein [Oscillospiraceae bacterium]
MADGNTATHTSQSEVLAGIINQAHTGTAARRAHSAEELRELDQLLAAAREEISKPLWPEDAPLPPPAEVQGLRNSAPGSVPPVAEAGALLPPLGGTQTPIAAELPLPEDPLSIAVTQSPDSPAPAYRPPFEYTKPEQRKATAVRFASRCTRTRNESMILCLTALLSLTVWFLGGTQGAASPAGAAAQLFFLAAAFCVRAPYLWEALKQKRRGADGLWAAAFLASVGSTVYLLYTENAVLGSSAPLVLVTAAGLSAVSYYTWKLGAGAFRFVTKEEPHPYSAFVNEENAICPARVGFPERFAAQAAHEPAADGFAGVFIPAAVALALAAGMAAGFFLHSIADGLCVAVSVLSCGIPVGLLLNVMVLRRRELQGKVPWRLLNTDAAAALAAQNALVIDSADLFQTQAGCLLGWKEFGAIRQDAALLYAAAVAVHGEGAIGGAFAAVTDGDKSVLPRLDSCFYEEAMGLRAVADGHIILLGNRLMMKTHCIGSLPTQSSERRHAVDGRSVLYLAVDGVLAALFIVKYAPDVRLRPLLVQLARQGKIVTACNTDPGVTQSGLCNAFRLPDNEIVLLPKRRSEAARVDMRTVLERAPGGVYFRASLGAYLGAIIDCTRLAHHVRVLRTFHVVGLAVTAAFCILAAVTGKAALLSPPALLLFGAIWNAAAGILRLQRER